MSTKKKLTHFVIREGRPVYEICTAIPNPDGNEPGTVSWGDENLNHLFDTTEDDASLVVALLDEFLITSPSTGRQARGSSPHEANENLYLGVPENDPLHARIASSDKWLYTVSHNFQGVLETDGAASRRLVLLPGRKPGKEKITLNADTIIGRIDSMIRRKSNHDRLPLVMMCVEHIFSQNPVQGQTGEELTAEAAANLMAEIKLLRDQLDKLTQGKES